MFDVRMEQKSREKFEGNQEAEETLCFVKYGCIWGNGDPRSENYD